MRSQLRFTVGFGALLAVLGLAIAAPIPAFADDATTVAFVEASPVTADFASPWVLTIAVSAVSGGGEHGYAEIEPESGTVDVYIDGIAGTYAGALPIQANGVVYFAQPASQPLLAAGSHTVRAIFNPSAGSRMQSSQTTNPATLTIEPFTVDATVNASMDAAVAEYPIVTAALMGDYVDAFGGPPAGIWTVTVAAADGEVVFAKAVVQEGLSADPVQIAVETKLARDTVFTVESTFAPDPSLSPGLTVNQAPMVEFNSAGATVGELLVTPVPTSLWTVVLGGVVLLLLVAATVWLTVLLVRKRRRRAAEMSHDLAQPSVESESTTASPLPEEGRESELEATTAEMQTSTPANAADEVLEVEKTDDDVSGQSTSDQVAGAPAVN